MIINISLEAKDLGNLEERIIKEAAKQVNNEVLNNRYEHYGKTFKEKLKEEMKMMWENIMDANFKNEVKKSLVDELIKKYIRSSQYKEIRNEFSIESDSIIKSGLRDIISDLISVELKKKFK